MKRLVVATAVLCGVIFGSSHNVMALPQFKKAFEEHYGLKAGELPELKAAMKKAACNACHVKGEKKTVQNSYGKALNELIEGSAKERLDNAKAISKDEQKAELAKLVGEFEAALPKVEEQDNGEGETYGARIKAGKLPVEPSASDEEEPLEEDQTGS